MVLDNRLSYTESFHKEIKEWVENNIARWQREKPDWFKIELVPDEFLPVAMSREAVGGARRRSSSVRVSIREIMGVREQRTIPRAASTDNSRQAKEAWKKLAEEIYELRGNDYETNL